ncbi:MAG TPA: L,D-transpeptidase family protein [Sphingomicrobium sp.]|nr:L,D-transpeptidase family protein [Sphingomicrobium sp.]
METLIRRAICAALAVALVPAFPAAAEPPSQPSAPTLASASTSTFITRSAQAPRSVLIDAASATLYMVEYGQIVDSMKVIVGKPTAATPELTTALTYATLNPYWHVPADIARTLTAPNVLQQGTKYLEERGYEVVSSFGPEAEVLDPSSIDWQAVADGRETVLVRQRPGPANSMGRMKFSLLNSDGIYLHDTPKKELFEQDDRSLSAGCVRLEDAPRFARWLVGDDATLATAVPERHVALPRMVPITITYLDPQAQTQLAELR